MPDVWPRAVLDLLAAAGDRTVFEHGDRHVSGAEMSELIRRIATGLRRDGIGPGSGVVLALGVHPEAFAAVFAAFAVGARVAGVRTDQLDDVLADAGLAPAGARSRTPARATDAQGRLR